MCKFFMTVTKESATEDYREVNLLPVKQVVGLLKFTDCSTEVLDVTMPTAKCPVLFQRIRLKGGERREKQEKAPGSQASPARSQLPAVRAVSRGSR